MAREPVGMGTLRILWASMLMAIGVFAVVASVTPAPPADPVSTYPIAAGGFLPAALSMLWGRVLATGVTGQQRWVVRWALGEATALFGLVVHFVGGPIWLVAVLFGLGAAVVVAQFPREDG